MTPERLGPRTLLAAVLGDRVQRNAGALALNAVVSSVLGLGYWWLAARNYDADIVGINAAMIATMTLVAGASDIGLKNGLVRFAGVAGRATRRLIGGAYAVSAVLSAAVGLVVVVAFPSAVGDPDGLRPMTALIFVLGAMTWAVFVLQDSVLTGFGRSSWVLIENTVYGVLKFAALVALAAGTVRLGIFISWTVPVALMVLVVNVGIFRMIDPSDAPAAVTVRELTRYAGSDFIASSMWKAATRGMPLAVLLLIGEEDTAYYHVAWSIAYVLYLLVSSVSEAIVADGATGPPDPGRLRRALVLDLALVVPAACFTAATAPLIMGVFGSDYSSSGASTLRYLALSAIPYAVTGSIIAVARIEQRLATIVATYTGLTVILAASAWPLSHRYGVAGIGAAWLLAQSVVAVALAVQRTELWTPLLARGRIADVHRVVTNLRTRTSTATRGRVARAVDVDSDSILWATEADGVAVAAVAGSGIVRLATSEVGAASVEANATALAGLHDHGDLGAWEAIVPALVDHRTHEDHPMSIEQLLHGRTGTDLVLAGADGDLLVEEALVAIDDLHARTSRSCVLDHTLVVDLVDEPLELIGRVRPPAWADDLQAVGAGLRDALLDRPVTLAWTHGDYWLSNILFDPTTLAVTGVVDWERASANGIPDLDGVTLAITRNAQRTGRELGTSVVEHLRSGRAPEVHRINPQIDDQTIVLLAWLAHVGGNLRRLPSRPPAHWAVHNVDAVLAAWRQLATH